MPVSNRKISRLIATLLPTIVLLLILGGGTIFVNIFISLRASQLAASHIVTTRKGLLFWPYHLDSLFHGPRPSKAVLAFCLK